MSYKVGRVSVSVSVQPLQTSDVRCIGCNQEATEVSLLYRRLTARNAAQSGLMSIRSTADIGHLSVGLVGTLHVCWPPAEHDLYTESIDSCSSPVESLTHTTVALKSWQWPGYRRYSKFLPETKPHVHGKTVTTIVTHEPPRGPSIQVFSLLA